MTDNEIVTKAKPQAIQRPQAYLTRSVFRFQDPTGLSPSQWRLIAREPINRSAIRFIIREISALEWQITSDRRDDPRIDDYAKRWDDIFEDGDGFQIALARGIEDACTLPFGAAFEVGYRGEDLDWCQHVDAATILPTYEKTAPYVQVNPDDWTQRVYFRRGQLQRLRVNPRPDIRFKEYQVSPTEDAFTEIEALSKIYLYYMQELTDTPPLGILTVLGWTERDATEWAYNFYETIQGTDPVKIPILYGDKITEPPGFIQFGRTPQDLNVVEQFKRFAESLLSKYGLSIGDLRLFEHDSTKAGERVSQLVTERSGVGFWAALIAHFITRLLPEGLTFEFKQPRPERELVVANRKAVQMNMLLAATGMLPLIDVKDAVEEARALDLFVTEVKEAEEPPMLPPPQNGKQPPELEELPGGEVEEVLDQESDQDLSKAWLDAAEAVEKQLGARWQHPRPPAVNRLTDALQRAFDNSARAVDRSQVSEAMALVEEAREVADVGEEPSEPSRRLTTTGPSGKSESLEGYEDSEDA